MKQLLLFTSDLAAALQTVLTARPYDRLYVLTDEHTHRHALPIIAPLLPTPYKTITIGIGETAKELTTIVHVWQQMQQTGASRRSILLNLGGGMVTDLGGFAASTFKRGMRFINLPTTILGAVDAAVGGKTGFNFGGLKNEIGVFAPADAVVIAPQFWETLPHEQRIGGFAEMIKHSLLKGEESLDRLLALDWQSPTLLSELLPLVEESVHVKETIVLQDPTEKGIRKALNLGHTIGHALEALALDRCFTLEHGAAVAWGTVGELFLSFRQCQFPFERLREITQYVRTHYPRPAFSCDDYTALLQWMTHDKKNEGGAINFTLLSSIGGIEINQTAADETIREALDWIREA